MKLFLIVVLVFKEIHALRVDKAHVKSVTKHGISSLRLCIRTCVQLKSIRCQYLKYNKESRQCLLSESKYADLAGWVAVKPEKDKKLTPILLKTTHKDSWNTTLYNDIVTMLVQLKKIFYLQEKGLELQKLLFGTENLAMTQLGRNILSHTVVSSARKNLQNLQTRLMQHQRQITLSSMKVLKSASFLLNFSCDNHKKTTLMENMNRLIETLHLDQRNLTRDILRNLLKTFRALRP
ncbi:uncharacterized protein LOC125651269 [Ostrea edulis]|uniref:uncharacterized protein LOC125651269 n=1 Tax=Ostrea edulis TaxID=37623 RepID=UPI0024AF5C87|nr:uncharacterized protein LOC125651269 [Ostrea edulis]